MIINRTTYLIEIEKRAIQHMVRASNVEQIQRRRDSDAREKQNALLRRCDMALLLRGLS
jgi:hypothetical protein